MPKRGKKGEIEDVPDAFIQVFGEGRNVDEHHRLRVAPKRVLEEVGELGVAERDVRVLRTQRKDDIL